MCSSDLGLFGYLFVTSRYTIRVFRWKDTVFRRTLPNVLPDVLPGVLPDEPPDVLPDVLPDVPPDVLPDVPPDVPPDALPDALPDVLPEKGSRCSQKQDLTVAIENHRTRALEVKYKQSYGRKRDFVP